MEFAGAVYHVTSRGDRREPIYRDDQDRLAHLDVLAQAVERFSAAVLAYCLMGNHYHLVLHTRAANLSRLMRHLNGVYTQRFNRRHGLAGHVFQGRFKAILVDRDAYLLSLCRYVERNPVAAGLVHAPQAWDWSSCRAHLGLVPSPGWLDTHGLHSQLLGRSLRGTADRRLAIAIYEEMLRSVANAGLWTTGLRQQVFLGDEGFVARMTAQLPTTTRRTVDVPRRQRAVPLNLQQLMRQGASREQALHTAYREGGLTMTQLARELGLSVSRVSRLIAAQELEQAKDKT